MKYLLALILPLQIFACDDCDIIKNHIINQYKQKIHEYELPFNGNCDYLRGQIHSYEEMLFFIDKHFILP